MKRATAVTISYVSAPRAGCMAQSGNTVSGNWSRKGAERLEARPRRRLMKLEQRSPVIASSCEAGSLKGCQAEQGRQQGGYKYRAKHATYGLGGAEQGALVPEQTVSVQRLVPVPARQQADDDRCGIADDK